MKRLLFLIPLIICSCNDWLDVQPEASVSAEELFSTEEGFFEAINGVYTRCNDNYFYGGLFSVEILDVMAQNYSFNVQDYTNYQKTSTFDFTDATLRWRNEQIWSIGYNAIVNANLILENIDAHQDVFHAGMYELVKGEALALRAYIHFDLLRYFALPYATGASTEAIPYVTTYSNKVTALSTVQEVVGRVTDDLKAARALLATADPILSDDYVVGYNTDAETVSTEMSNTNLFLQNRRHRLNYYAVCATLARAYLYTGNTSEAYAMAREVIEAQKFPWVNVDDFLAAEQTRDRLMYTEIIFGWYAENRITDMEARYENTVTGYFIHGDHAASIYETALAGADDIRFKGWFFQTSNDRQIIKYLRNSEEVGNRHYLIIPAIRLSEMYYIAAEAVYNSDPAAAATLLNEVRTHRGIRVALDKDCNFVDELLREYRKETYAEGQSFYAYKRLGRNIVAENGAPYLPSVIAPVPLPDAEIEFGNR
ncbi:MAG: RagB/SusD family nutrient uptake outer membrane protein [Dysgonamonadaceae bacterium]|nr:RagB/SusD family nutrient uptake outer membrane protein [Dysgonamonadaceae bacterium]